MRTLVVLSLCAIALVLSSCQDSPTATTTVKIGRTTVADMLTVPAYKAWFDPGYNGYPAASDVATFNAAVASIQSNFNAAEHMLVMAVKPNCGCQTTQLWMPRVMKTLDAAGVPAANVEVFITDSRLGGIDTIERRYGIDIRSAPVFIIARNNVVEQMIDPVDFTPSQRIENELASAFAKP